MATTSRTTASRTTRPVRGGTVPASRPAFGGHTAELMGLALACAGLALLIALGSL